MLQRRGPRSLADLLKSKDGRDLLHITRSSILPSSRANPPTSSLLSPYSSTFPLKKKAHPIVSNSNCLAEKVFSSPTTTNFARDLRKYTLRAQSFNFHIPWKLFEMTQTAAQAGINSKSGISRQTFSNYISQSFGN